MATLAGDIVLAFLAIFALLIVGAAAFGVLQMAAEYVAMQMKK